MTFAVMALTAKRSAWSNLFSYIISTTRFLHNTIPRLHGIPYAIADSIVWDSLRNPIVMNRRRHLEADHLPSSKFLTFSSGGGQVYRET